jgi:hypothetical protein
MVRRPDEPSAAVVGWAEPVLNRHVPPEAGTLPHFCRKQFHPVHFLGYHMHSLVLRPMKISGQLRNATCILTSPELSRSFTSQ